LEAVWREREKEKMIGSRKRSALGGVREMVVFSFINMNILPAKAEEAIKR
jgi:hypothetical protein